MAIFKPVDGDGVLAGGFGINQAISDKKTAMASENLEIITNNPRINPNAISDPTYGKSLSKSGYSLMKNVYETGMLKADNRMSAKLKSPVMIRRFTKMFRVFIDAIHIIENV